MLSNAVYIVKIDRKELPNKYIGSKTNCYYKDNILYDSEGKPYWGSSTDEEYHELIKDCSINKTIEIISWEASAIEALEKEREVHIEYDVVSNSEFFNKSVAMVNTFSLPGYGTYKHKDSGKVVRLPIDHPKVLDKTYVGVTKGRPHTEEYKQNKRDYYKSNINPFKGKTHTEESLNKMSAGHKRWWNSLSEEESKIERKKRSDRARNTFTGRKQSKEHIKKRTGHKKGMVPIINIDTGERRFIETEKYEEYDKEVWYTQAKYQMIGRKKYINVCTKETRFLEKPIDENWVLSTVYFENKIREYRECVICKNEFGINRSEANKKTCSRECSSKFRSKRSPKSNKGRKKYKNIKTGEFKYFKEDPGLEWVWWADPNRVIATKTCIICYNDFDILKKEKYLRSTCTKECAGRLIANKLTKKDDDKDEDCIN